MSFDVAGVIASTGVDARPYQQRVVQKAVDMFTGEYVNKHGNQLPASQSVMIESPTGSGKTVMGHLTVKALQALNPDLVVGWVAMRRNLLSQAAAENCRIGVENIHYISMFDSNPAALLDARRLGKKIILVVDEAQHDAASTMASLHESIAPDMILGLTATPFRTDSMKLCFNHVIKDAGIHQLIQDGYLSEYHHFVIDDWTPEVVAEHYCREPERWGKSVVFFLEWEQCERFAHLLELRESEVRDRLRQRDDMPLGRSLVSTVRGGGSPKDRDDILDAFRDGDIGVLVNCMVLTEGFDAPSLMTAFVRDSVKGPTMQMAGRAFRKHPRASADRRFAVKHVVQSKNTKWPITKTAMSRVQYQWQESNWRSLTVNPEIDNIQSEVRRQIAQINVEMPQFITARNKKKRRISFG